MGKVILDNEGNVIGRIEDAPARSGESGCGAGCLGLLMCACGLLLFFVEKNPNHLIGVVVGAVLVLSAVRNEF